MPVVGEFHGFFWDGVPGSTAGQPQPPGGPTRPGYPGWQVSVIAPSLFGVIGAWLDTRWAQVKWWLWFGRRVNALDRERRAVLLTVLDRLDSPAYPLAQAAVRQTATTLGFNRPEAWIQLSREIKASPGRAENQYRHLNACTLLNAASRAAGSTLSNPVQHLTVELAYTGFAAMGK